MMVDRKELFDAIETCLTVHTNVFHNNQQPSLRDQFAMAALQGNLANPYIMKIMYEDKQPKPIKDFMSELAYYYADAMLKQREEGRE